MDNFEYFNRQLKKEKSRIYDSKIGLEAEKVIVPAVTHEEYVEYRRSYGQEWYDSRDGFETVVDREEIVEQDLERQKESRDFLRFKHTTSDWFIIRYIAGEGLSENVSRKVPFWSNALRDALETIPFTSDLRAKYLIDVNELFRKTRLDKLKGILVNEFNQTSVKKVKQEVGTYLGLGFWKRNFGKIKAPNPHSLSS